MKRQLSKVISSLLCAVMPIICLAADIELAKSDKLGLTFNVTPKNGQWCEEKVQLNVVAKQQNNFDHPDYEKYRHYVVTKGMEENCPKLQTVEIYEYISDSNSDAANSYLVDKTNNWNPPPLPRMETVPTDTNPPIILDETDFPETNISVPSTTTNTQSQTTQPSPKKTAEYALGAELNFYQLKGERISLNKPSTFSIGAMLDKKVQPFKSDSFLQDKALTKYKNEAYGLLWSGVLHNTTAGKNLLSIELNIVNHGKHYYYEINGGKNSSDACYASFEIEGQRILEAFYGRAAREKLIINTTTLNMEEGHFQYELWLTCGASKNPSMAQVTISHRGPNDRVLQPIPKSDFYYSKN